MIKMPLVIVIFRLILTRIAEKFDAKNNNMPVLSKKFIAVAVCEVIVQIPVRVVADF